MKKRWKITGINFDHMHMGDLLRMVHDHPDAEITGICDEQPARMREAIANFSIPTDRVFTDYRRCMEQARPDLVILCPGTADHARWTRRIAPYGSHILMEKPFAATLADADAMIAAVAATGKQLVINWPLRWYPSHVTAKRLIDEKRIGRVIEVHYYDGNRGPLWHGADKDEKTAAQVAKEKPKSWFYKKAHGGGSLLDYLGYGTTLGTWYQGGRRPLEVTATVDEPKGLEVDEHSIVVARYAHGLSKFETRWGTFSDPWILQPQPRCGFIIAGTEGTISSYDYDDYVTVQTRRKPQPHRLPAPAPKAPNQNPVQYLVDRLSKGKALEGPVSIRISRIGQEIVDAAVRSAKLKKMVKL